MSNECLSWAMQQETDTPVDKMVLVVLADHADRNDVAFPSMARIAQMARASEHTVRRSVQALAEQGFIVEMDGGAPGSAKAWKVGK